MRAGDAPVGRMGCPPPASAHRARALRPRCPPHARLPHTLFCAAPWPCCRRTHAAAPCPRRGGRRRRGRLSRPAVSGLPTEPLHIHSRRQLCGGCAAARRCAACYAQSLPGLPASGCLLGFRCWPGCTCAFWAVAVRLAAVQQCQLSLHRQSAWLAGRCLLVRPSLSVRLAVLGTALLGGLRCSEKGRHHSRHRQGTAAGSSGVGACRTAAMQPACPGAPVPAAAARRSARALVRPNDQMNSGFGWRHGRLAAQGLLAWVVGLVGCFGQRDGLLSLPVCFELTSLILTLCFPVVG